MEAIASSLITSGANIWYIALKETRTYFASPMAYVVAAAFLAITGFFFVASVSDAFSEASIRGFSAGAIFFMIFLSPALTMRLLAEEQKLGTLELLLTSPVRETEIVLGKFVAAFVMLTIMLALSLSRRLSFFLSERKTCGQDYGRNRSDYFDTCAVLR